MFRKQYEVLRIVRPFAYLRYFVYAVPTVKAQANEKTQGIIDADSEKLLTTCSVKIGMEEDWFSLQNSNGR